MKRALHMPQRMPVCFHMHAAQLCGLVLALFGCINAFSGFILAYYRGTTSMITSWWNLETCTGIPPALACPVDNPLKCKYIGSCIYPKAPDYGCMTRAGFVRCTSSRVVPELNNGSGPHFTMMRPRDEEDYDSE